MNTGLSSVLLMVDGEDEVYVVYLDQNGSKIGISHCILAIKQLPNISTLKLYIWSSTSVYRFVLVPNHTRWHQQPLLDHFEGSILDKVTVTTFLVFISKRTHNN